MLKDIGIAIDVNKDFLQKYYTDIQKAFPLINPDHLQVSLALPSS
jgi:hypothetical protein